MNKFSCTLFLSLIWLISYSQTTIKGILDTADIANMEADSTSYIDYAFWGETRRMYCTKVDTNVVSFWRKNREAYKSTTIKSFETNYLSGYQTPHLHTHNYSRLIGFFSLGWCFLDLQKISFPYHIIPASEITGAIIQPYSYAMFMFSHNNPSNIKFIQNIPITLTAFNDGFLFGKFKGFWKDDVGENHSIEGSFKIKLIPIPRD